MGWPHPEERMQRKYTKQFMKASRRNSANGETKTEKMLVTERGGGGLLVMLSTLGYKLMAVAVCK